MYAGELLIAVEAWLELVDCQGLILIVIIQIKAG